MDFLTSASLAVGNWFTTVSVEQNNNDYPSGLRKSRPPPPAWLILESTSSKNYLPSKAWSFLGSRAFRRSAQGSSLLTPPFRLDLRRISTLKSPISSTRAIPLGVVLAFAVSQQCDETVTVPSFPIFTFCKKKKQKQKKALVDWCPILLLPIDCPAQFISNPNQTHLKQPIKVFRITWKLKAGVFD